MTYSLQVRLMVDGIQYHRLDADELNYEWDLDVITDGEGPVDKKYLEAVWLSVFSHVRFDSAVEQSLAIQLEDMHEDILTYLK